MAALLPHENIGGISRVEYVIFQSVRTRQIHENVYVNYFLMENGALGYPKANFFKIGSLFCVLL